MTTRHFYYLTVIADLGNLSAAAEKLQISQPALSKFLQAMAGTVLTLVGLLISEWPFSANKK